MASNNWWHHFKQRSWTVFWHSEYVLGGVFSAETTLSLRTTPVKFTKLIFFFFFLLAVMAIFNPFYFKSKSVVLFETETQEKTLLVSFASWCQVQIHILKLEAGVLIWSKNFLCFTPEFTVCLLSLKKKFYTWKMSKQKLHNKFSLKRKIRS